MPFFKTYGKGKINVSTNKAYINHFFNTSLSEFQKIIPSLCQIQLNAKRISTWFLFAIFKYPWSIPVNILPVFPWLELDNDRFHCQSQTFILIRLTYTMHPIYLRLLVRQTDFTKTFRDFWNDITLTFIFIIFHTLHSNAVSSTVLIIFVTFYT